MFVDSIIFDGQFYDTATTQYVETKKVEVNPLVTIQDNDNLFCFVNLNNDNNVGREFVYDLYADSKNFGKEELEAEERIIRKNSIPVKNNFFDYYE